MNGVSIEGVRILGGIMNRYKQLMNMTNDKLKCLCLQVSIKRIDAFKDDVDMITYIIMNESHLEDLEDGN